MTTTTVHYFTSNKSLPAAVVVTVTVIIFNGVPSFIIMFTRERNAQRNKLSQQEQKGHVLYKKTQNLLQNCTSQNGCKIWCWYFVAEARFNDQAGDAGIVHGQRAKQASLQKTMTKGTVIKWAEWVSINNIMIMSVAYFITLYVIKYMHIIYMPSQNHLLNFHVFFKLTKLCIYWP